jgi:hypothetical protein
VYESLWPREIKTRIELFQPREFSAGARAVDPRHVGRLATRIKNVGELDPPLVVKLGKQWVCVDGHHRLAAYARQQWSDQIKCEWFSGTAQEAADESMRRNGMLKLEVPLADRQEEAWKRTLADPKGGLWSKAHLAKLCGIAETTIALMRRVIRRYYDKSDQTEWTREFRRNVGRITECSWSTAQMANAGASPRERTVEAQAATLAKALRARLTNRLSESAEVTALALVIYDPELAENLRSELDAAIRRREKQPDADAA